MNFNYDLMTWVEYFVGSFICCFGIFVTNKILIKYKFRDIKWTNYILIIIFSVFIVFNTLIFDSIAKVFGSFLIFYLIPKLMFKQNNFVSFVYALSTYIIYIVSEATISLLVAIVEWITKYGIMKNFAKTIVINIIISAISVIYANIIKEKFKKIINKININGIIYVIFLGIITIFVIFSSLYELYINNWMINYSFILNAIIFLGCLFITILLLKQYLKNKEMMDKYNLLNDYMKTSAELIEKYSSTVHKYKNNLIAIKGYLKSSEKIAENYIDNLLDDYNNHKYNWFRKINYIQIDAVRYLIYYKLSKAEMENLNIIVDVSKSVLKYKNDIFSIKQNNILLEMIGEFFDNAIYASNESKEKELNFMLYTDEDSLVFKLANTFKERDIDLSMIIKNGYTTKGKGHGFGLYDIDKNAKRYNWINVQYEILSDYFVVSLYIKNK